MTAIPELTSSSSSASSSYLTRDAVHSFFDRVMDMFLSSSDASPSNKKVRGVAAKGDYAHDEHSAWTGEDEEDVLLTQGQMQVNRILMNKGLHLNGESSSSGSGDDSSDEDDDEFDDEDDGSAAVDDSHRHKREKEHHSVHHTPSFPSLVVGGVRMLDFSRTSHRDRTIFYGTHLRPILTAITERTEEDSMSLANSQSIRPSFSSSQTSSDIATAFSNLSQALRMAKTSSFSAYAGTAPPASAAGRGTATAAAYDSGDNATANNTSSSSLSTADESIQKAKSSSKKLRKTKSSSSHRSVKSATSKDEKQLKKSNNSKKESNLTTWVDVSDTEEETDEEASR